MAEYLVIGMQSFDFKSDDGKNIKGSSIFFLDKAADNDSFVGYKTGKMSVPDSMTKAFTAIPGIYDLDFSVKVGAGGKIAASLNSIGFIAPAKFMQEKQGVKA